MLKMNPICTGMCAVVIAVLLSAPIFAEENTKDFDGNTTEEELQDMSDPLAVFTQAGIGWSNKGLNIKYGKTYDTGSVTSMGMNVFEIKGIGGDALAWSGHHSRDNSIDSFRFRDANIDTTNGRGKLIDIDYNIDENMGSLSYSIIQALPKFGPVQFYPLVGVGTTVANNTVFDGEDDGFTVPGMFTLVGMYSTIRINEEFWFNYNPYWFNTIGGSTAYTENAFGLGKDSILLHEFAASYQINPRFNVRYFANWDEDTDYIDGDHRIEFNYQF